MAISMYAASIPVFKKTLNNLNDILHKAEAHALEKKIDPGILLQSRLFPDMFPLVRQVQIAADFAKSVPARLAGVDVPSYEDKEQTFADLYARIEKTLAFVETIPAAKVDGSEERAIVLNPGTQRERKFTGQPYLVHYALPNFFFHVTTAYAILRHNGLNIGKSDFIGTL